MKKVLAGLLVAGLVAFTGCNESKPGGPGVTTKKDTPGSSPRAGGYGAETPRKADGGRREGDSDVVKTGTENKDLTSKVRAPLTDTTLKQGETKTVKLTLSRGKNFAQPVTLKLKDNKMGLKFDPA